MILNVDVHRELPAMAEKRSENINVVLADHDQGWCCRFVKGGFPSSSSTERTRKPASDRASWHIVTHRNKLAAYFGIRGSSH